MGVRVLGELGLVTAVSEGSDSGMPYMLGGLEGKSGKAWREVMSDVAKSVSDSLF